jgi:hypothetical protein
MVVARRQYDEPTGDREPGRSSFPTSVGWLLMFLASAVLYAATASRGAQWQDSGEFILRIINGDLFGRLGLALSHPLHHWLGRGAIVPGLLEPAFSVTLISSLSAALAVANVFGCVRTLTGSASAAFFAAISLALANTFWKLATIAEVYTLSAALFTAECWCLAVYARRGSRWAIWGMCLMNGLGLANHLQALLTLPMLALVILHGVFSKRLKTGALLIGFWLWLLGSLPYTGLVLGQIVHGDDPVETLRSALFGAGYAEAVLSTGINKRMILTDVGFPLLNFPNLLIPAAAYGLLRSRRVGVPVLAWLALAAGLVIHAVFALRYNVVDQHTFFLPMYTLLAIFGGIGAAAVQRWPSGWRRETLSAAAILLLAATPLLNMAAAATARRMQLLNRFGFAHRKPYRDDYTYLLIPWSVVDRSAERMSREAVELAGPDGLVIVEDSMAFFAIEYSRLRAGMSSLRVKQAPMVDPDKRPAPLPTDLADEARSLSASGHPVGLVPLDRTCPAFTPPLGQWERRGDLYVLVRPRTAPSTLPATEAAR